MPTGVNADFSRLAIVHTARAEWQPSPSPSVWRKRLDLTGPSESSRVTSVVRYDRDSAFPSHPHPDGEEILVLDGVFSDEHGDYPAGTYLLNPEGFAHAPFSTKGCVLFVKLQQYPGTARRQINIDTTTAEWRPAEGPGAYRLPLYGEDGYPETMRLFRLDPGAESPLHDHPGGEEIFVVSGDLHDEHGSYEAGSWIRYPAGSSHAARSTGGCTLYVKSGHLGG
ncbi:MAG: cupin domain-containing protein [Alphaproteobacteria bacterium]|nr:cupin domain-containing protein [Alphaproteobacteria bacterium]